VRQPRCTVRSDTPIATAASASVSPGEEHQLDDAHELRIHRLEALERVVQVEHVERGRRAADRVGRERDALAAALVRLTAARMVDQHRPHRLAGQREERAAAGRTGRRQSGEAQPGLVHERGRLQRVGRRLIAELTLGEGMQLAVDPGREVDRRTLRRAIAR
jgi:hypothetical protein